MNWGSIAAQLAAGGASTATIQTALDAAQHQYPSPSQGGQVLNALAAQQQAAAAEQQMVAQLINQQQRNIDLATLDLCGLWISAQGFWMEVVCDVKRYSYVGKNLWDVQVETGQIWPSSPSSVTIVGRNAFLGEFRGELTMVNQDLLVAVKNGLVANIFRHISRSGSKPYLT